MKQIQLNIDGKQLQAGEGMSLLEAAESGGISIPKLCHNEKLIPYGGCRLCIVELESEGSSRLVVSCVYPAENNLVVKTRSEKIDRIRKTILELLLAHAPNSPELHEMSEVYGANKDRFDKEASFCIHCGLCVRYCAEVKQLNAVGFIERGSKKEICFIPEIAMKECNSCKECFPLCPTSYLQAAFVLTEALSSVRSISDSSSIKSDNDHK
jgi:NADH dehydrogenase/NADH:ubiquinone oxidoreductase subunit G